MRKSRNRLKGGYWLVIAGMAAMTGELMLDVLILGELCCGVLDYFLLRDLRGIVECSLYPFVKVRITSWLAVGLGIVLMGSSIVSRAFSAFRS